MGLFILKMMGISLAATIILELLFALFWGIRNKKDLLLLCLVNLLTNPVVVFIYYISKFYSDLDLIVVVLVLEVLAVLLEGFYYKRYGKMYRDPYYFSFFANVFSFAIGKIISIIL